MKPTLVAGPTGAYVTEASLKRKEVNSLANYLRGRFKIYVEMKLDHDEKIGEHLIRYEAKKGQYWLDLNPYPCEIGYIAFTLRNQFNIKNPNSRDKWVKIP